MNFDRDIANACNATKSAQGDLVAITDETGVVPGMKLEPVDTCAADQPIVADGLAEQRAVAASDASGPAPERPRKDASGPAPERSGNDASALVEQIDGDQDEARDGELGDDETGDQHGDSPRVELMRRCRNVGFRKVTQVTCARIIRRVLLTAAGCRGPSPARATRPAPSR